MKWIYLSPHLDDAVLSCGGMIWQQVQAGLHVEIWTIFAGDPPAGQPLTPFAQTLHERWGLDSRAVALRRAEDLEACRRLGATPHHFDLPECIYRRNEADGSPLVEKEAHLWQPRHLAEAGLIRQVSLRIAEQLPRQARLALPFSMGGHIDHRLVRAAAEQVGRSLWFYPDFPYSTQPGVTLSDFVDPHWLQLSFAVSIGGLVAWQEAIAAYRSQIGSFWPNLDAMREDMVEYWRHDGGSILWQPEAQAA